MRLVRIGLWLHYTYNIYRYENDQSVRLAENVVYDHVTEVIEKLKESEKDNQYD